MTTPRDIPEPVEKPLSVERKGRSGATGGSASRSSLGLRVRRAQQGDPQALDSLVRDFQSMAVGYAASLLGDRHSADDVAQEALVEALRRLASLRVPEAFPALLQTLIRKHCDRLNRRRRLTFTSLPETTEENRNADDPMQQVQAAAQRDLIRQAVRELPSAEREVVLLFYGENLSLQETADRLNLPVSTVKSRLYEARVRLKRKMWMFGEEADGATAPKPIRGEVVKKKYIAESNGSTTVRKNYIQEPE